MPEWLGDDLIDDGQLDAKFLLLGYLKLPENECDTAPDPLSFAELFTVISISDDFSSLPDLSVFVFHSCCCGCFCEIFPYNGFTFFKYFLKTSFAEELIFLTCDPDTVSGSGLFFVDSFLNTEENLDNEKYLLFLIGLCKLGLESLLLLLLLMLLLLLLLRFFAVLVPNRALNSSSSVTELGLEESQSVRSTMSLLNEE